MKHPLFNVEMFEDGQAADTLAEVFSISELADYIRLAAYGEANLVDEIKETTNSSRVSYLLVELAAAHEVTLCFIDAIDMADHRTETDDEEKIEILRYSLNLAERNALQHTIWKGIQHLCGAKEEGNTSRQIGMSKHEILLKAATLTDEERAALEANTND